ncbi:hypothetical protein NMY22_g15574 [Coprinellus aureogranulatus]|nr:hypothetical protein NMY22_g15574 [Coprinellus aureogranulatus]
MDLPQPSSTQAPAPILTAQNPQVPHDASNFQVPHDASNLQPSISADQTSQLVSQVHGELKAKFDEEWARREAMFFGELERARAAQAALEAQLQEARETARDQPMAPPEPLPAQTPRPPAPVPVPQSLRPMRTPSPTRVPLPHSAHSFGLTPRGRPASRGMQLFSQAGPSSARHRRPHQDSRSASPLSRRENARRQREQSPTPPVSPAADQRDNTPGDDASMDEDDLPSLGELQDELEDGLQEVEDEGPRSRRLNYQLKRTDLPADIGGFKVRKSVDLLRTTCSSTHQAALVMHLRIIWRLLHPSDIPQDPTPSALANFNKRFHSTTSLDVQRRSGTLLIAVNRVRGVRTLVNSGLSDSKVVKIITKMEENIKRTSSCTSTAALRVSGWKSGAPTSTKVLTPSTMLCIVSSPWTPSNGPSSRTHTLRSDRSSRISIGQPRAVVAVDEANPNYRNRTRLCAARRSWLMANGFHRYLPLVTRKSTSDDERDPERRKIRGRPLFFIKPRPERSEQVTRLFRILDTKCEKEARLDPSRRWRERVRRDPPGGAEETAFPSIPLNMPADYFDPTFFNNELPPNLRAKAATYHVTLLPNVEESFTRCEDELLSADDFDAKYADERLAQYNMVDDVDLMFPEDDDYDADAEVNAEA